MTKTLTALTLALGAGLLATAVAADPVDGVWKTGTSDAGQFLHVQLAPCDGAICGTIAGAYEASGTPVSDYTATGKRMIWGMIPDGAGGYADGKIWAPDQDKTYRGKMQLSGDMLEVKGCVAGGLVCRGQTWSRVK